MKSQSSLSLVVALAAVCLSGCASIVWQPGQGGLVYTQPKNLAPKSTFHLKVYKSAADVPYKYQQIGLIRLSPWTGAASPNTKWQVNEMKVEAAKRGADAIILPAASTPPAKAMEAIAIVRQ